MFKLPRTFVKLGAKFRQFSSFQGITSTPMPEIADLSPAIKTHEDLHRFSLQNPDKFWSVLARSRLRWIKDFSVTSDCDMKAGQVSWFKGGVLNASGISF